MLNNYFFSFPFNFLYLYRTLFSRSFASAPVLEFIWTLTPTLILLFLSLPTMVYLYTMDCQEIASFLVKVTGHQWYWHYELNFVYLNFLDFLNFYQANISKNFFTSKSCLFFAFSQVSDIDLKNTYVTINLPYFFEVEQFQKNTNNLLLGELRLLEVSSDFVLPVDKMIKLVITSIDVLHSWTIPGFGIKMDAVPGRLNVVFLRSRLPGVFYGQCSELCGINHGFMPIKLIFHN